MTEPLTLLKTMNADRMAAPAKGPYRRSSNRDSLKRTKAHKNIALSTTRSGTLEVKQKEKMVVFQAPVPHNMPPTAPVMKAKKKVLSTLRSGTSKVKQIEKIAATHATPGNTAPGNGTVCGTGYQPLPHRHQQASLSYRPQLIAPSSKAANRRMSGLPFGAPSEAQDASEQRMTEPLTLTKSRKDS